MNKKRIKIWNITLVMSVLLSFSLRAIPIWTNKVSGGDDIMLGTIHLGDERLNSLPDEIKALVDNADLIVMELDLSRYSQSQMQQMMMEYGGLPAGESLHQHLSSNVYKKVQNHLEKVGYSIEQFARVKPWMLALSMVQISYVQQGLRADKGVDKQIEAYALATGKKIFPLETFKQQLNFFNAIIEQNPQLSNDELVMDTLLELEQFSDLPQQMLSAWFSGDMTLFETFYQQTLGQTNFDKGAEKVLLTDRNLTWHQQLPELFKQHKVLVAVGTLHFVGKNGLPNLFLGEFKQVTH